MNETREKIGDGVWSKEKNGDCEERVNESKLLEYE